MFATKPQLAGGLLDRAHARGFQAAFAPPRPGPPAALVGLAAPPPAPRP
jgi:hypothetical protein